MKYAVRVDVLGVAATTEQVRDVQDFLNSRTDLAIEKIITKGDLTRTSLRVEATSELTALQQGIDALLGALYMIVGPSNEMPSVSAFAQGTM